MPFSDVPLTTEAVYNIAPKSVGELNLINNNSTSGLRILIIIVMMPIQFLQLENKLVGAFW